MKIDEIKANKAYYVKDEGVVLVLAVGHYMIEYNKNMSVTWNGVNIVTDTWYKRGLTSERRGVVAFNLRGRVFTTTPGMLKYEVDEETVKKHLHSTLINGDNKEIRNLKRRKQNAETGLMSIARALAPDVTPNKVDYYHREDPLRWISYSDNFPKMLLLWMNYHLKTGQPINGDTNIESMIDDFREYASFLKDADSLMEKAEQDKKNTAKENVERNWKGWVAPVVKEEAQ